MRFLKRLTLFAISLLGSHWLFQLDIPVLAASTETVSYRIMVKRPQIQLTLSSTAELPGIQHELLSNQEGFIIHFSRPVDLQPENPKQISPLLLITSAEKDGLSVLVLLTGIRALKKIDEGSTQVTFTMATVSPNLAEYYGAKGQELEKVKDAVQKAREAQAIQASAEATQEGDRSSTSKTVPESTPRDAKNGVKRDHEFQDLPPPLRLNGSLGIGYYHAETINGLNANQSAVLNDVRLNLSGYWHHPKVFSYEIKPQLSFGRQSSEAILADGQGITASSTFLGGGAFPLTVSYSLLRRQLVTFGTLDRLAGLEADSSQSSLTVNWQLAFRRMPQINIYFSRYADSYDPLVAVTSRIQNGARVFSMQSRDTRWGWQWNSELRVEGSETSLLDLVNLKQKPFGFFRNVKEFRGSGSKEVTPWLSLDLFAGRSASQNEIDSHPFEQNFTYFYGNAHFRRGEKLNGMVRGGVISNLVGFQLAQFLPTSSGQKALSLPASGITVFELGKAHSTLVTLSGQVEYGLTKDLKLNSQVNHNSTRAPDSQNTINKNTSLNTLWGGLNYSHHFHWGQLQARYMANMGNSDFSETNKSRMAGHNASSSVTMGSPDKVEIVASIQGIRQNATGSINVQDRDFGGGLSLSRKMVGGFNARVSYNLDQSHFDSNGTRFESTLQNWGVTVAHRRGEFSYTRQFRRGLSFQPDLRLGTVSPTQARNLLGAVPNLLVIPSQYYWTGFTASFNPIKKMTGRLIYGWNQQLVGRGKRNQYTQWEAFLTYQFRLLSVDFGYISHEQNFENDQFSRNRIFFRLVRDFHAF